MPEDKEKLRQIPKGMSFTKFEKICDCHTQDKNSVCYCSLTNGTCSKYNCPKWRR